jgi:hypothetical protein
MRTLLRTCIAVIGLVIVYGRDQVLADGCFYRLCREGSYEFCNCICANGNTPYGVPNTPCDSSGLTCGGGPEPSPPDEGVLCQSITFSGGCTANYGECDHWTDCCSDFCHDFGICVPFGS